MPHDKPDVDPRLRLAYDESIRALEHQAEGLDQLRTRSAFLLSAAAITSGLFGSQILRDHSLTCWSWLALGAFALIVASSLYIQWPRKWLFANSATSLLGTWVDSEDTSIDQMTREVATFNQTNRVSHRPKLDRMWIAFQVASAALGAEVVLWMIDLGTR